MTVHVACAAHGRYVVHSGALLASLGAEAHVHYLHGPELGARSRRRLAASARGGVSFCEVDPRRVADLPVRGPFTHAMWFRLLAPELIEAERVLYLDVDTLVLGDLRELWATDLAGAWVGAVTNVVQPDHRFHLGELGVAARDYFNSGVLLLDLQALRAAGAMAEVRAAARARAELPGWPDQDALNLVLGPHRAALHPRWNAMNALWTIADAGELLGTGAVREAREQPGIRHFEGPDANKPWRRGSDVAHRDAWRACRRASAFGRLARP